MHKKNAALGTCIAVKITKSVSKRLALGICFALGACTENTILF